MLNFNIENKLYNGKVRDVYYLADNFIVLKASDRISAFDVILPKLIKHKGAVLDGIATSMLEVTRDICPNWLIKNISAGVSFGYQCQPIPVEVVVRNYLCGHAFRTYSKGERILCGVLLADGLKENDPLPLPIITPSTKATEGHDEDTSEKEIIEKGILTSAQWKLISDKALALFAKGQEIALQHGLILADTKYEFGWYNGELLVMDEIHTPDSSRYFWAEGYTERQNNGEKQKQLSKEFVREWLIANNFMGLQGQEIPILTDEFIFEVQNKYISLYETILNKKFNPQYLTDEAVVLEIENLITELNK